MADYNGSQPPSSSSTSSPSYVGGGYGSSSSSSQSHHRNTTTTGSSYYTGTSNTSPLHHHATMTGAAYATSPLGETLSNPKTTPTSAAGAAAAATGPVLRRRNIDGGGFGGSTTPTNGSYTSSTNQYQSHHKPFPTAAVQKLDFMFPKVEKEYTVQTDRGGIVSLIAYCLIAVLAITEFASWYGQNRDTVEHISVDTTLGARMSVNLNITFPALACIDLHVDVMDVAGDSQINIEDTMVKQRYNRNGVLIGARERVESNLHRKTQEERDKILKEELPKDYCGPCYGAHETEDQCCNTCDELVDAYKKKRWRSDQIISASEQCIREGRDKAQAKKMTKGEGCNLSGSFTINRVAGNFHIAMGEGVERDGRHIHTFLPEDTPNFNASHIIHHLSFGPPLDDDPGAGKQKIMSTTSGSSGDDQSLNGVTKIVTKEYGTTGLFQYFIKIVPTTYIEPGKDPVTANRYFFTERFRPLMSEYLDDEEHKDEEDPARKAVKAGSAGHAREDHHNVRNAVLPGVFWVFEIYPFALEITKNRVPFTHLAIRLMATVGGVFTIVKWADAYLYARDRVKR